MEKIQILAIGRDPVVLQKLLRFINENPKWEGSGTVSDETAIEVFLQRKYDIVLLIDSLGEESEKKFNSLFTFNNSDLIFIKHTGDSSGLLASEIYEALQSQKPKVNIVDDAFKNKSEE
jgi:hypothetical protein